MAYLGPYLGWEQLPTVSGLRRLGTPRGGRPRSRLRIPVAPLRGRVRRHARGLLRPGQHGLLISVPATVHSFGRKISNIFYGN